MYKETFSNGITLIYKKAVEMENNAQYIALQSVVDENTSVNIFFPRSLIVNKAHIIDDYLINLGLDVDEQERAKVRMLEVLEGPCDIEKAGKISLDALYENLAEEVEASAKEKADIFEKNDRIYIANPVFDNIVARIKGSGYNKDEIIEQLKADKILIHQPGRNNIQIRRDKKQERLKCIAKKGYFSKLKIDNEQTRKGEAS